MLKDVFRPFQPSKQYKILPKLSSHSCETAPDVSNLNELAFYRVVFF